MQKEYKTILFDLDNTLVDDDENIKYAIKKERLAASYQTLSVSVLFSLIFLSATN